MFCMYKAAARFAHRLRCRGKSIGTRMQTSYTYVRMPKVRQEPIKPGTIRNARVYVVRFLLREDQKQTFIKVGVSGLSLGERFRDEKKRYIIDIVHEGTWHSWKDAELIEMAIHRVLRKRRVRPQVVLTSGNTECYSDNDETLTLIRHFDGS